MTVANTFPNSVLPWQRNVWHDLLQRHQHSGLPHALMLTGIAGIGKHTLSLNLARWLLCQQPVTDKPDGACGHCHSCELWQAGSHPDFMLCQPEESSRQIRIDSIRKVNDFLAQTPQISHCQVVVIRPVEVMNTNAANALLKTLEEPAGESFLLLEAERFGSVLPTIRSRCQRIQLQAPSPEAAVGWLIEQGVASDQANQALRYNPQAPLMAKHWIEHELGQQQQQWQQAFQQWTTGQASLETTMSGINKMELDAVIGWFSTAMADALKYSLGVRAEQLVFAEMIPAVLPDATLNQAKLITLQRKIQEVQGNLMSGVAHYNKQLLNESLLLDWRDALH